MSTEFNLRINLGNAAMLEPEDVADALVDVAARVRNRGLPKSDEGYTILDLNGQPVGTWKAQRVVRKNRPGAVGAARRIDGLRAREAVVQIMALLGANETWEGPSEYLEAIAEILNAAFSSVVGSCSNQSEGVLGEWRDIADELGIGHDGEE